VVWIDLKECVLLLDVHLLNQKLCPGGFEEQSATTATTALGFAALSVAALF
jgi:hypothetical protein